MHYVQEIKQILAAARQRAFRAINSALIEGYWHIGQRIVEEEQNGSDRAEYGKEIIKNISKELTAEFGKGYSTRTIWEIRQFYISFPQEEIVRTLSAQLSWSHFQRTLRVADADARLYYLNEAASQMWSIKTLDRNISTRYYHRILSSQNKTVVEDKLDNRPENEQQDTFDFIKNPTVLEFLNLPANYGYTEAELEKALIDNLQKFILELGKGFAFVARQQHIKTETADFYIDLVFYNYILKCFVIVELKTQTITHQHIGQLDMYVRMFDDLKKQADDNPTIGILLCTETDKTVAKYSVLNQSKQLFASRYFDYLPTEQELIDEIEREKMQFKLLYPQNNEH